MMSKSFEKVHAMQLLHIRAIFAQNTLAWDMRPLAPAPLSLLMLPYKMCAAVWSLLGHCQCSSYIEQVDDNDRADGMNDPRAPGDLHVSRTFLKKDVEQLQRKMDQEVQRLTSRIKEEENVAEEIRSALETVRRRVCQGCGTREVPPLSGSCIDYWPSVAW